MRCQALGAGGSGNAGSGSARFRVAILSNATWAEIRVGRAPMPCSSGVRRNSRVRAKVAATLVLAQPRPLARKKTRPMAPSIMMFDQFTALR
ncbi:hypothetical protein D3C85_1495020 [compost metagenome]